MEDHAFVLCNERLSLTFSLRGQSMPLLNTVYDTILDSPTVLTPFLGLPQLFIYLYGVGNNIFLEYFLVGPNLSNWTQKTIRLTHWMDGKGSRLLCSSRLLTHYIYLETFSQHVKMPTAPNMEYPRFCIPLSEPIPVCHAKPAVLLVRIEVHMVEPRMDGPSIVRLLGISSKVCGKE